jgi:hypothetical protein
VGQFSVGANMLKLKIFARSVLPALRSNESPNPISQLRDLLEAAVTQASLRNYP